VLLRARFLVSKGRLCFWLSIVAFLIHAIDRLAESY
jgi:hypothetical protein